MPRGKAAVGRATVKKVASAKEVEALKHVSSRRKNIPTAELEAFAQEAEKKPGALLYPRDPSLDPQLVWKGKDEQDAKDLAVPVVPVYIQEKIAPQAIIEDLLAEQRRGAPEPQLDLFSDFNGIPFEQLIDFYKHDQHWSNRMILGDSLAVMASLAEKEGLKGQIQMIYVDPPYGIEFRSNWQVSTRRRNVVDGRPEDATRQPEQIRAFRDTWNLGINSYLSYLRDRLIVSRDLLAPSGSCFVQIGDKNVHLVRSVLDEVFGSENFVAQINFKSMSALGQSGLAKTYDYIIWYAKAADQMKFRPFYQPRDIAEDREYRFIDEPGQPSGIRRLTDEEFAQIEDQGRVFRRSKLTSSGFTPSCTFTFEFGGVLCKPFGGKSWRTNTEGMQRLIRLDRLFLLGGSPYYKQYQADFPYVQLENSWRDQPAAESKAYVVETAPKFVQRCMLMATDPGDLVLDPTCGSGTTAYVAEQWGRRWITIDTSRVALALARTRLMAARYPYYLLKDSPVGIRREAELLGQPPPEVSLPTSGDLRQGFVYDRVPHVTLKSIANNPDLDQEMSPTELAAAIRRNAVREPLYDRPFPDPKIVRVTGPFTVESLSPHRVLDGPGADPSQNGEDDGFISVILENLRKAGVQNTVKNERLTFERLDPWPGGAYIQALGDYRSGEASRPVAVAIGPEYGTVSVEFVREAAKEAIRIADLLIVCGFAFEAQVEDTSRLGKLTILKAKMNPDLAMGDELLKKTGAGNLFMVFGEPDVQINNERDGEYSVEIRGVDVYDPTTGVVRSRSTEDIAAWFIDTEYNGESFFVRHAYFLGANDPYDKLRRALRADIDEAAWSSLHSAKSRPFPKPDTGKIAVKVINHYGDEVLKVYSVGDRTSDERFARPDSKRPTTGTG